MASSSFLTSGRSRRRVVLVWQPSREDEYEGPWRYCHHGFVAPRWTEWTRGNPGRRFYGCPNYNQDDACGFFAWHDVEFGERANVVIKQLLDDIDKLYDESKRIRGGEVAGFMEELDSIHGELRRLRHKYKIRETDVIKGERKFKIVMVILMLTWVWILFFS